MIHSSDYSVETTAVTTGGIPLRSSADTQNICLKTWLKKNTDYHNSSYIRTTVGGDTLLHRSRMTYMHTTSIFTDQNIRFVIRSFCQ